MDPKWQKLKEQWEQMAQGEFQVETYRPLEWFPHWSPEAVKELEKHLLWKKETYEREKSRQVLEETDPKQAFFAWMKIYLGAKYQSEYPISVLGRDVACSLLIQTLVKKEKKVLISKTGNTYYEDMLRKSLRAFVTLEDDVDEGMNDKADKDSKYILEELVKKVLVKKEDIGLLILESPSAFTGKCLTRSGWKEILRICQQKDIWILCEESYLPFSNQVNGKSIQTLGITENTQKLITIYDNYIMFPFLKDRSCQLVFHDMNIGKQVMAELTKKGLSYYGRNIGNLLLPDEELKRQYKEAFNGYLTRNLNYLKGLEKKESCNNANTETKVKFTFISEFLVLVEINTDKWNKVWKLELSRAIRMERIPQINGCRIKLWINLLSSLDEIKSIMGNITY